MNYYEILEISENASQEVIHMAYKALCKKYHPDANIGKPDAAQAERKFMEVQQAYEEIMHRRQGGGARAGSGYNGQQQRPGYSGYGGYQGQYQDDPFAEFFGGYGYGQVSAGPVEYLYPRGQLPGPCGKPEK